MSETHKPDLAASLIRVHLVITRALGVTIEHSQSFAQQGFSDAQTQLGFVSYVQSLASFLNAHHLTEDKVVFPYFRNKVPDSPIDLLMSQHQQMVALLDEIKVAIEKAATDLQARDALNSLFRASTKLNGIWHPHIATEEGYFTSKWIDALVNPEEQTKLIRLSAEHSQKLSTPDYLVTPFVLYNLPPRERTIMSHEMPPLVTQQLVPVVWKDKWQPMSSFLLD